jgi:hypothetical protein
VSLVEQLWGSQHEKLHTIGTTLLGMSLVSFLALRPLSKEDSLLVFYLFGFGCGMMGFACLKNAWCRWRTGEDTLILLRRRGTDFPVRHVSIHVFGRTLSWEGRIAHVDVGSFSLTPLGPNPSPPRGALTGRAYGLFRAAYWAGCSSITFQAIFGLSAFLYGLWLMTFLQTYLYSNV